MNFNKAIPRFCFIFLTVLSGCSRSTPQSSVTPKLQANSFIDISPLPGERASLSSFSESSYNPAARLENEVAPGYLISISSVQDSNLNGQFRISELGILELPYNVKVSTNNLSLSELRSSIRDAYRGFFRSTPDLDVSIKEKKVWVKVQGLVNKPGFFLVQPEGGLDEVIAQAGGLKTGNDGLSSPKFARINVDGNEASIRLSDFYAGNSALVSGWRGGETVFFQSEVPSGVSRPEFDAKYVHVLGQVRAPGEYAFKDQANFFYYLVQAGGPTDRANTEKILLVSSNQADGSMKTSKISLSDMEDAPALKGGDVLFVQADNQTDLQRDAGVLGSIGGFIGSIATTILVGNEL